MFPTAFTAFPTAFPTVFPVVATAFTAFPVATRTTTTALYSRRNLAASGDALESSRRGFRSPHAARLLNDIIVDIDAGRQRIVLRDTRGEVEGSGVVIVDGEFGPGRLVAGFGKGIGGTVGGLRCGRERIVQGRRGEVHRGASSLLLPLLSQASSSHLIVAAAGVGGPLWQPAAALHIHRIPYIRSSAAQSKRVGILSQALGRATAALTHHTAAAATALVFPVIATLALLLTADVAVAGREYVFVRPGAAAALLVRIVADGRKGDRIRSRRRDCVEGRLDHRAAREWIDVGLCNGGHWLTDNFAGARNVGTTVGRGPCFNGNGGTGPCSRRRSTTKDACESIIDSVAKGGGGTSSLLLPRKPATMTVSERPVAHFY